MTRTAVAIRHVPFEDLGTLAPLLESRGYRTRTIDIGVESPPDGLESADLLIVLGGPIGVHEGSRYPFLDSERRIIEARLSEEKAVLGICLGAQLIASVLGAPVFSDGRVEIGYAPLTLTAAGRASVLAPIGQTPVLHWHQDQFALPAGTRSLAGTPGFPNQAFAVGSHALALQFHLEADHSRIESWLIGHAHELAAHGVDPRRIRADATRYGLDLRAASTAVLSSWLDGLDSEPEQPE